MNRSDAVVVGAGPYGLSLAAHTRAAGLRVRVLGRTMDTWAAHMPAGMLLKSESWASHLSAPAPGHGLDAWAAAHERPYAHGTPVPVEDFTAYGRWFREHAAGDVEDTEAVSIGGRPGRFTVTTADGETLTTRTVLLAVGVLPFRHLPPALRGLPGALAGHTGAYDDLTPFKGRRVAVVGAGQSALETAALLAEAGAEPRLVARTPALRWNTPPAEGGRPLTDRLRAPEAGLGPGWPNWVFSRLPAPLHHAPAPARLYAVRRALGPAGAWWLRDRVEGVVEQLLGHRLDGAHPHGGGVRLELTGPTGHRTLDADHVVAGTGYRVDLARLPLLERDLAEQVRTAGGYPVLDAHFQTSVPGLFAAGLAAAGSFGPVMRFVYGAPFAARRITARLRHGRDRAARRTP